MVSVTEARAQLTQTRQRIRQQQQQAADTRREIEQSRVRDLTRQEIQTRDRQGLIRRKVEVERFASLKQEKLRELEPIETQIRQSSSEADAFEIRVQEVEEQSRFNDILNRIARDRPIPPGTTPQEVARAEKILEPFKAKTVKQIQAELEKIRGIEQIDIPPTLMTIGKDLPMVKVEVEDVGGIFFKPGERADGRTFVPESELDLKEITAKDVLTRDILFEEPKFIPVKAQEFGAKVQKKLEEAKIKTLIAVAPTFKEEVNKQKREAEKVRVKFEELDEKIIDFNKKYGQAGLSPAQFRAAEKAQGNINKGINDFEKLITDTEQAQLKRIKEKNVIKQGLATASEGFVLGLFSAPFDFTSFVVGGVTQPKRTVLGFNADITDLPSQIAQAPFSTGGFVAGQVIVQSKLANVALKGVKKGAVKLGKTGKVTFDIKKVNANNNFFQKILKSQKRLLKDKRGTAFAEAAQILSKKKKKKKKKGVLSPEEALAEFARSFRKRKIDIIESAFKERIRSGGRITKVEIQRAIKFMKRAGLKETDIGFILAEIFRRQEIQLLRGNFKQGLISKEVFNTRKTKLINLKLQLVKQQKKVKISDARIREFQLFAQKMPKKARQQLIKKQKQIQKQPQQKLLQAKQKQLIKQRTKFRQVQKESTLQVQKSTQKFLVLQAAATTTQQKQKQLALFKQAQKVAQKQLQKEQSKLVTINLQVARLKGASPTALRKISRAQTRALKPKKVTIPKIITDPKIKQEKLIKAIQKLGTKGVDVLVGLQVGKRKVIAKNLPKWKALRKAQRFVDQNIQASFVLKKSGKRAKGKDIKPFSPSPKFRSSKTNPLFRVEMRRFRLDTPTERRQIKAFKGAVPSGFFPKRRKRRKKR